MCIMAKSFKIIKHHTKMTRLSTLKLKFNNAYHQYNEKNKKGGERWRDITAGGNYTPILGLVSFHKAN